MRFLSTTRQRVGAAAAAVAIAGGAGAFVLVSGAFASASTPQSTTAAAVATTHHAKGKGKKHGLLAHSDYATVQVKRHGQWVTYVLDRGKVTAITPTEITIARPDGVTVDVALSSTTKYKGVSGESSVQVGQHASVISENGTAVRVSQLQHQAKSASTTAALTSVSGR